MTVEIDERALDSAWSHGDDATAELGAARRRTSSASPDLGGITDVLRACADDVDGALEVAESVIAEHRTGSDECVAEYRRTDGAVAGGFDGLL